MDSRPIRFHHRGAVAQVQGLPPATTVLDWLREHARCTGTKEGCAEGDCGACTVAVGELDPAGRGVQWQAVNACTAFLPTLDGRALLTVEDLGGTHPAQAALVECHGSQCGFCTPGFVMSMAACHERHSAAGTRPSRQDLADELAGNLCRCTGYRPILDAGARMFDLPAQRLPGAPVAEALRALQADPPLAGDGFAAPRTIDALAEALERTPHARLLAGSTDIGLWVNKQFRALGPLVYVGRVDAMKRIERRADGGLSIGAAASLEDAWSALAERHPELRAMWLRFASPPVRRAGTMGGNVANGSPIGDSAPVLMALDAALVLRRGRAVRTLALEDFYLDYMKNRLEPGEFVQAIELPPVPGRVLRAYKLAKRYDSDISAVACGVAVDVNDDGTVRAARFAFGGMAAVVRRAAAAEAAVVGRPWDEPALRAAQAALARDFAPLTDLRASAAYRAQAAASLLERFWRETAPAAGAGAALDLRQVEASA